MEDELEPAVELRRAVAAAYEREHEALLAAFRDLDGKAQATITVAGIFLAAALAFVEDAPSATAPTVLVRALLGSTLFLLVASISAALLALQLRKIVRSPSAVQIGRFVSDLVAAGSDEARKRMGDFYGQVSRLWGASIESLETANARKSRCLVVAQLLLFLAILGAFFLVMVRL
jgi:hypothetical protein